MQRKLRSFFTLLLTGLASVGMNSRALAQNLDISSQILRTLERGQHPYIYDEDDLFRFLQETKPKPADRAKVLEVLHERVLSLPVGHINEGRWIRSLRHVYRNESERRFGKELLLKRLSILAEKGQPLFHTLSYFPDPAEISRTLQEELLGIFANWLKNRTSGQEGSLRARNQLAAFLTTKRQQERLQQILFENFSHRPEIYNFDVLLDYVSPLDGNNLSKNVAEVLFRRLPNESVADALDRIKRDYISLLSNRRVASDSELRKAILKKISLLLQYGRKRNLGPHPAILQSWEIVFAVATQSELSVLTRLLDDIRRSPVAWYALLIARPNFQQFRLSMDTDADNPIVQLRRDLLRLENVLPMRDPKSSTLLPGESRVAWTTELESSLNRFNLADQRVLRYLQLLAAKEEIQSLHLNLNRRDRLRQEITTKQVEQIEGLFDRYSSIPAPHEFPKNIRKKEFDTLAFNLSFDDEIPIREEEFALRLLTLREFARKSPMGNTLVRMSALRTTLQRLLILREPKSESTVDKRKRLKREYRKLRVRLMDGSTVESRFPILPSEDGATYHRDLAAFARMHGHVQDQNQNESEALILQISKIQNAIRELQTIRDFPLSGAERSSRLHSARAILYEVYEAFDKSQDLKKREAREILYEVIRANGYLVHGNLKSSLESLHASLQRLDTHGRLRTIAKISEVYASRGEASREAWIYAVSILGQMDHALDRLTQRRLLEPSEQFQNFATFLASVRQLSEVLEIPNGILPSFFEESSREGTRFLDQFEEFQKVERALFALQSTIDLVKQIRDQASSLLEIEKRKGAETESSIGASILETWSDFGLPHFRMEAALKTTEALLLEHRNQVKLPRTENHLTSHKSSILDRLAKSIMDIATLRSRERPALRAIAASLQSEGTDWRIDYLIQDLLQRRSKLTNDLAVIFGGLFEEKIFHYVLEVGRNITGVLNLDSDKGTPMRRMEYATSALSTKDPEIEFLKKKIHEVASKKGIPIVFRFFERRAPSEQPRYAIADRDDARTSVMSERDFERYGVSPLESKGSPFLVLAEFFVDESHRLPREVFFGEIPAIELAVRDPFDFQRLTSGLDESVSSLRDYLQKYPSDVLRLRDINRLKVTQLIAALAYAEDLSYQEIQFELEERAKLQQDLIAVIRHRNHSMHRSGFSVISGGSTPTTKRKGERPKLTVIEGGSRAPNAKSLTHPKDAEQFVGGRKSADALPVSPSLDQRVNSLFEDSFSSLRENLTMEGLNLGSSPAPGLPFLRGFIEKGDLQGFYYPTLMSAIENFEGKEPLQIKGRGVLILAFDELAKSGAIYVFENDYKGRTVFSEFLIWNARSLPSLLNDSLSWFRRLHSEFGVAFFRDRVLEFRDDGAIWKQGSLARPYAESKDAWIAFLRYAESSSKDKSEKFSVLRQIAVSILEIETDHFLGLEASDEAFLRLLEENFPIEQELFRKLRFVSQRPMDSKGLDVAVEIFRLLDSEDSRSFSNEKAHNLFILKDYFFKKIVGFLRVHGAEGSSDVVLHQAFRFPNLQPHYDLFAQHLVLRKSYRFPIKAQLPVIR